MAYTPPSGGAVNVELAGAGAYTPPAGNTLSFEMDSSGGSGDIQFINVYGQITLAGYGPASSSVAFTLVVSGEVSITFPEPTYHITRTTQLDVYCQLPIVGYGPTGVSTKETEISAEGQIAISWIQPGFFIGKTLQIDVYGVISVQGDAGITQTKVSHTDVPAGTVTLSLPTPTYRVAQPVAYGAVSLQLQDISYKQLIRNEIGSKYYTPDLTLSAEGVISVIGYGPTHKMQVRSGIGLSYGLTSVIAREYIIRYTSRVFSEKGSMYSTYAPVAGEATGVYSLKTTDPVASQINSAYRFSVVSEISSEYSVKTNTAIRSAFAAPYALVQNVNVRAAVTGVYKFTTVICKEIQAPYYMTSPLVVEKASLYSAEAALMARAGVGGIYSMTTPQVVSITAEPYVEYFGERLGVEAADIEASEGEYLWKASITLTHVSDYVKLRADQPFAVVIGSERFEFIVDTKELDRSNPANYAAKLYGVSPTVKFSHPRHVASSYLWDTAVQAKDVAEEVLPLVDWQVLDWTIPAYRLAIQDASPVSVVKLLAEAIGATLETDLDGTPYVRSLYPVSVPNYYTATPAHVLLEATDIITVSESYVSFDTYNRLTITDVSNDIADSLEWIPDYDEAQTGIVRAFLYPWRSGVQLKHSGLPGVFIDSPIMGMEQHEEIIEVFQGQGSTQYPIHHVESIDYEADVVGSLVFDVDSRSFTVSGPLFNSVIRVVYWTRSYDYRVSMPEARPTQFLLESSPF